MNEYQKFREYAFSFLHNQKRGGFSISVKEFESCIAIYYGGKWIASVSINKGERERPLLFDDGIGYASETASADIAIRYLRELLNNAWWD